MGATSRADRAALPEDQLTEGLLAEINTHLSDRRLFVGKGAIVDATIINAPSSTENEQKQRDPQMHQTRKGKRGYQQWYFGMKVHPGSDANSGLVHAVKGMAANVADVNVLGELLRGGEERLHGDSAYHTKALEAPAETKEPAPSTAR